MTKHVTAQHCCWYYSISSSERERDPRAPPAMICGGAAVQFKKSADGCLLVNDSTVRTLDCVSVGSKTTDFIIQIYAHSIKHQQTVCSKSKNLL